MNNLDETRLTTERSAECQQHSISITTGNVALLTQNTQNSSPVYVNRRKSTSNSNNMTSYSALKRKTQRSDLSSNISRVERL